MRAPLQKLTRIERIVTWVGSLSSLVVHTLMFIAFFAAVWLDILSLSSMLLILTTVVSLEAIYLAIFIQMTVNKNTASLREVEEDLEELDVEEEEDEVIQRRQSEVLDRLMQDMHRIIADVEALKRKL